MEAQRVRPSELLRQLNHSVYAATTLYNKADVAVTGIPFTAVLAPSPLVVKSEKVAAR